MEHHFTKDEKSFIDNSKAANYLIISHPKGSRTDAFKVYNQSCTELYSICVTSNIAIDKNKKRRTLIIKDSNDIFVGSLEWGLEINATTIFSGKWGTVEGEIKYNSESGRSIWNRKSWYEASFSEWKLQYADVWSDSDHIATIKKIYNHNILGKEIRVSYIVHKNYSVNSDLNEPANDLLLLLFWGIRYLCDDYEALHRNMVFEKVNTAYNKRKSETKRKLENAKTILEKRERDAKETYERGVSTDQEQAIRYIEEKQMAYQEKMQNLTRKQRILRAFRSIVLCIIVPFFGICMQVVVEQYSSVKMDSTVVIIFGVILAILLINWNNPNLILVYGWLGLAGGLLLSSIIGLIIGRVFDEMLLQSGYPNANLSLSLIAFLMAVFAKWKAKHIPGLANKKTILTTVQFLSMGFVFGRVAELFLKQSGYRILFIGIVCILIIMLLKRVRILVNYKIISSLTGVFLGIALSGLF